MPPSNRLSYETGNFSCSHNTHKFLRAEVLRLYYPSTDTLDCTVCLILQLFLLVYPHCNVGLLSQPAAASLDLSDSCCFTTCILCLHCPSLPLLTVWMNVSSLTPCFLDFQYSSIFWQFWGFFVVVKLVVIFLLVV